MDSSGCTFLCKVLPKINGVVSDMSCIPVTFVNPDKPYLSLFLCLMRFATDLCRVSLGDFITEKLMRFSVHCVCTYSAGTLSEHDTSLPTFFMVLCYSEFGDMNVHSLPQEVAAAAVYCFL